MSLKLYGVNLSPYVRKVRVILAEKGLDYEHEPLMPFAFSDEYVAKHPLKKIPLLEADGRPIPDSSAIATYLEGLAPTPALYPANPYERARAVWLEEFADDGVAGGAGPVFQENLLAKVFFNRESDAERVAKAQNETLPPLFDYLEGQLGDQDYLLPSGFSIADVAVGSQLVNLKHGHGEVDAARWPKVAAWVERVHGRPSFKGLIEEEQAGIKAAG